MIQLYFKGSFNFNGMFGSEKIWGKMERRKIDGKSRRKEKCEIK